MNTKLISIGNSKGIIIPKRILLQLGITKEKGVNYEVAGEKIIITPIKHPRQGLEKSFKRMHKNKDDAFIIPENIDLEWD